MYLYKTQSQVVSVLLQVYDVLSKSSNQPQAWYYSNPALEIRLVLFLLNFAIKPSDAPEDMTYNLFGNNASRRGQ